jgi:hypothetical protein
MGVPSSRARQALLNRIARDIAGVALIFLLALVTTGAVSSSKDAFAVYYEVHFVPTCLFVHLVHAVHASIASPTATLQQRHVLSTAQRLHWSVFRDQEVSGAEDLVVQNALRSLRIEDFRGAGWHNE